MVEQFLSPSSLATYATTADQDQLSHPCCLIMVCTINSIQSEHIYKISLKMMNGLVHIERWTSLFKIFSVESVNNVFYG
jgi:hypothetical protein